MFKCLFYSLLFLLCACSMAFAEDGSSNPTGWYAIAAGIGLGIAALGGALGQGKVASSAMEGISRNPGARKDMFIPFILGLVFIETLSIYTLLIAILLVFKF